MLIVRIAYTSNFSSNLLFDMQLSEERQYQQLYTFFGWKEIYYNYQYLLLKVNNITKIQRTTGLLL